MLTRPIDFIHDADILASLHTQCFPQAWNAKTFANFATTAQGLLLSVNAADSENSRTTNIGFVIYSIAADQADLITLGVIPQSQQQGAGRLLLEHAFLHLSGVGVKELFLEVSVQNAAALALYKRMGFLQVGTRPRYYEDEEGTFTDAAIFFKKVSSNDAF
jgi:ribosomal-protein-alanine N-acetyltransferase